MQQLIKAGVIAHQRVFHGNHGVNFITKEGARHTNLPPIKSIPKDNYQHQLAIIEVYFKLREQFPEAEWVGERRIKHEKFMGGFGKKGHLADGMLIFPDLQQVAIKVELTLKSRKRLEDIIWRYSTHKYIKVVWYYCSPEVMGKMNKMADKAPRIKIHGLG